MARPMAHPIGNSRVHLVNGVSRGLFHGVCQAICHWTKARIGYPIELHGFPPWYVSWCLPCITRPPSPFVGRCRAYARPPQKRFVVGCSSRFMRLAQHLPAVLALVQAMCAWSGTTRGAPSRRCSIWQKGRYTLPANQKQKMTKKKGTLLFADGDSLFHLKSTRN